MKRFLKFAFFILLGLLIIAGIGFYVWSQQTYAASSNIEEWIGEVDTDDGWVVYEPDGEPEGGVVLYPGAKVEPEAYSYIAEQLSEAGYVAGVPNVRLNLALLNANKAQELVDRYPDIEEWYVGGHSLGGVAAATFAREKNADGVIFLASYPTEGSSFAGTDTPVLSIYAEQDGLSTPAKIEETKAYLSDEAELHEIEGGNHAQFGVYGEQKGDNQADISMKEQQDEIVEVITDWLEAQK
ncbi:alpha/beta family hydrolase [Halobacillus salinus]|uniref:alpha/beta family hydrolase n=1 Tax=Halobacillus salinus TaxID=192814 RepID=UPI0009A8D9B5|nr:alpha/beta family hydrolase [Halobacillus salinus]